MKTIVIDHEPFYSQPEKTWAEIIYALNANIDAPVFIDNESILRSNKSLEKMPDLTVVKIAEYLTERFVLQPPDCYKIFPKASSDRILCLDLRGLRLTHVIGIADALAKTAFGLKDRPTVYVLLVEDLSGLDFAEFWYKAFYIEPYPIKDLQNYLNDTLKRMKLRAFVLRYFGPRMQRILRSIWRFSLKVRGR